MNFYRFKPNAADDAQPTYFPPSQPLVKAHIKAVPTGMREAAVVDLISVATDRDGVLDILNGAPKIEVLKTFEVTVRGSMNEVGDESAR